jgi:hypothetical protein
MLLAIAKTAGPDLMESVIGWVCGDKDEDDEMAVATSKHMAMVDHI